MATFRALSLCMESQYNLALGKRDVAKSLAVKSLTEIESLSGKIPDAEFQPLLRLALEGFDNIEHNVVPSKQRQIELLTSRIGNILLLPWPEYTPSDVTPTIEPGGVDFTDSSGPEAGNNTEFARLPSLAEIVRVNEHLEMDLAGDRITQSALGDCSVVATLVSINSLRTRNGKDILLHRLFPRIGSKPAFSKYGHYMLKLPIGGTERIIEIDDRVPVGTIGGSPPRHVQTAKGSLWPALFEKAYLKAMGGYDFEGSHCAIDTFYLTGWIPSYVATSVCQRNPIEEQSKLLKKLQADWNSGILLICVGTGQNPSGGLVPNHDYAVEELDVESSAFRVINPWGAAAAPREPIWYSWQELVATFDMIYLNYDPSRFQHTEQMHVLVPTASLVAATSEDYRPFPQYAVELSDQTESLAFVVVVKPMGGPDSITQGYVGIEVYDSAERLIVTTHTPLIAKSAETNSLCTSLFLENIKTRSLLVVATLRDFASSLPTLALTARVYSTSPIASFGKATQAGQRHKVSGQWRQGSVAGNYLSPSYALNTQYRLSLPSGADRLRVHLQPGPDTHVPSHIAMLWAAKDDPNLPLSTITSMDVLATSGQYLHGINHFETTNVRPGEYILIPSLFEPGTGSYSIIVQADRSASLQRLASASAGLFERTAQAQVPAGQRQARFKLSAETALRGVAVTVSAHTGRLKMRVQQPGLYSSSPDTSPSQKIDIRGNVVVIALLAHSDEPTTVKLTALSEHPVDIQIL